MVTDADFARLWGEFLRERRDMWRGQLEEETSDIRNADRIRGKIAEDKAMLDLGSVVGRGLEKNVDTPSTK